MRRALLFILCLAALPLLAQQTGSLVIETDPEGAQVVLNGVTKGETPLTIDKLQIGEYTITLTKSGYRPTMKRVQVQEGQTTTLSEVLRVLVTTVVENVVEEPVVQPAVQPTVQPTVQYNTNYDYSPQLTVEEEIPYGALGWEYIYGDDEDIKKMKKHKKEKRPRGFDKYFFMGAEGAMQLLTTPSVALVFGQELGHFGWWTRLASGFDYNCFRASYICDNTGYIPALDIRPFYYPGAASYTRISATVGTMYKFHPMVGIYLGAGYGYSAEAWYTTDFRVICNADHTAHGVDVLAGLHMNLGGFLLRIGAVTTNFKTIELTAGIGFSAMQKN